MYQNVSKCWLHSTTELPQDSSLRFIGKASGHQKLTELQECRSVEMTIHHDQLEGSLVPGIHGINGIHGLKTPFLWGFYNIGYLYLSVIFWTIYNFYLFLDRLWLMTMCSLLGCVHAASRPQLPANLQWIPECSRACGSARGNPAATARDDFGNMFLLFALEIT